MPYYLHTSFGQGSPAGGHTAFSISSGGGAQCVHEAASYGTRWVSLQVEESLLRMLQHSPLSAGSNSRRSLQGCVTVPCRSTREPGWNSHAESMCRGYVNMAFTDSSSSGLFCQVQESSCVSPTHCM